MARRRNANAVPSFAGESVTHEVRKIKNGYILRKSHSKPDGTYSSEETYHPVKPQMPTTAPAAKPAMTNRRRKR